MRLSFNRKIKLNTKSYLRAGFIAFCFFGWASAGLFAQKKEIDTTPTLHGAQQEGSQMLISYLIPFDGVVEVKLYNKDGRRIWREQYDRPQGENIIKLKIDKLEPGEEYKYTVFYKGHLMEDKFTR